MLEEAFGYAGCRRYVAFYWEPFGDELAWYDGETGVVGANWPSWIALMHHPLYRLVSGHFNFGSSNELCTHWLVLDRKDRQFYIADRDEADRFMKSTNEACDPAYRPRQSSTALDLDGLADEIKRGEGAVQRLCDWLNEEMVRLMSATETLIAPGGPEARCIHCGCSDDLACMTLEGPCHWVWVDRKTGRGLCSGCHRSEIAPGNGQPLIIPG
ncbi:MAG: hypothetical protein HZA04_02745 [Nitrospinae bacterium]|nr:hypothetical protein [Nitrospinota bacterium]